METIDDHNVCSILKGYNILCFGSEKWEYPGYQQTTMKILSRSNNILWINSLGTRKISLRRNDWPYYFSKFRSLFASKDKISESVTVRNLFIIPLVYNRVIGILNKMLLKIQLKVFLKKLNFSRYILWVGSPTAAVIAGSLNPDFLIYNPVDRYYAFSFVNSDKIKKYEEIIARRADLIITTSDAIKEDMLKYNRNCEVINHGVLFSHFYRATAALAEPSDLKSLKKPLIGYYGAISDWIDLDLIKKAALAYPHASFVLIGNSNSDLSLIKKVSNIHVLGFRKFEDLPSYLKYFNVCLIPFRSNDLIEGVDPIKLREYLCAGKPVVTSNFREARKYDQIIYVSKNDDEFIGNLHKAMKETDGAIIDKRISTAANEDWAIKIQHISSLILGMVNDKRMA